MIKQDPMLDESNPIPMKDTNISTKLPSYDPMYNSGR